MLRSQAVIRIRRGLGFNNRIEDSYIIDALQDAQTQLEQRSELPWFLIVQERSLFTVANIETIALPDDFLRDVEQRSMFVVANGKRTEVLKTPWDQDLSHGDEDDVTEITGKPQYFRVEYDRIRFYPIPDAAYTLKYNYIKKDEVLLTDIENLWLLHTPNLLIGFAGQIIAAAADNDKSYQKFAELRARGESDLAADTVARRETGVSYQIGGPH